MCADEVISPLLGKGYKVIVRPHPHTRSVIARDGNPFQQRYSAVFCLTELHFEQDFSTSESIYDSNVLITDWSSIACEFSFATLKPSIFVDTPMKVWNPDRRELGIEPTNITDVATRSALRLRSMISGASPRWSRICSRILTAGAIGCSRRAAR